MEAGAMQIPLTRGQVAYVSPRVYEYFRQFRWQASWSSTTKSYYAYRHGRDENGKKIRIAMHRQVLGLSRGDPRHGDHINHDTLDNTDSNLRAVSKEQNARNHRRLKENNSGFKGVRFLPNQRSRPFQARIKVDGRLLSLGLFKTAEEAHVAYCSAAMEHHGQFAHFG